MDVSRNNPTSVIQTLPSLPTTQPNQVTFPTCPTEPQAQLIQNKSLLHDTPSPQQHVKQSFLQAYVSQNKRELSVEQVNHELELFLKDCFKDTK